MLRRTAIRAITRSSYNAQPVIPIGVRTLANRSTTPPTTGRGREQRGGISSELRSKYVDTINVNGLQADYAKETEQQRSKRGIPNPNSRPHSHATPNTLPQASNDDVGDMAANAMKSMAQHMSNRVSFVSATNRGVDLSKVEKKTISGDEGLDEIMSLEAEMSPNKSTPAQKQKLTPIPRVDPEVIFKESKLNKVFARPVTEPSYFTKMKHGEGLFFSGHRRVTTANNEASDRVELFLCRTIDTQNPRLLDRVMSMDFYSGLPSDVVVEAILSPDLTRAQVIDRHPDTGVVISRTLIHFAGPKWGWTHALAVSQQEPVDENGHVDEDADRAVVVSRTRFYADGHLSEKVSILGNTMVLTTVDDVRLTSEAQFEGRTKQLREQFNEQMSRDLEDAAQAYDQSGGTDAGPLQELLQTEVLEKMDKMLSSGGSGEGGRKKGRAGRRDGNEGEEQLSTLEAMSREIKEQIRIQEEEEARRKGLGGGGNIGGIGSGRGKRR